MNKEKKSFYIDNITWNDLDMDRVAALIDHSGSSVGREYIYSSLHNLCLDGELLKDRDKRADYFNENGRDLSRLEKIFKDLGFTKKVSFYDYIFRLKELKPRSNALHFILILLLLAAIALLFVLPVAGVIALVVIIAVNIIVYFRVKAEIEGYFQCLKYLVSMVNAAGRINRLDVMKADEFSKIHDNLSASVKSFSGLKRGAWLLTNSVSGSLVDVILDYVRMITHIDLIKFNLMRKEALSKEDEIRQLYNALGETELSISLFKFRKTLKSYCKPEFGGAGLCVKELYHPLITDPVSNDIDVNGSVLLTGSNASGKSTFLKSLAINQILAQTIYTCMAQECRTGYFKVLSSMALKDNLQDNESYFVVEIKSLKRIFDELGDVPLLCFIDEVLRGTNTAERIAASSEILKSLSKSNAIIFAATHDIELTNILKDYMNNYHFSEQVDGEQITFDYKLKEGSADSRNAIKLLKAYGFDTDIVVNAEKIADEYTT